MHGVLRVCSGGRYQCLSGFDSIPAGSLRGKEEVMGGGPKEIVSALKTLRLHKPAWFGSGSMFVVSTRLLGTAVVRNSP